MCKGLSKSATPTAPLPYNPKWISVKKILFADQKLWNLAQVISIMIIRNVESFIKIGHAHRPPPI